MTGRGAVTGIVVAVEPRHGTEERSAVASGEQPVRDRPILHARWLGRVAYRDAWALQQALAAARSDGALADDQLLLLEHDPVLTLGRNADPEHVLAPRELLAARGIEVLRVERGGEVTYHGPGQLVAYPVVALGTGRGALGVRSFVAALEGAMEDVCAASGVAAGPRAGHPGTWAGSGDGPVRKVGAIGIRIARGVSFHGIALNVSTDLADFDLIDPCGMPGLRSTSLAHERARIARAGHAGHAERRHAGDPPGTPRSAGADLADGPTTESVAWAAAIFAPALARRLGRQLAGVLPPAADPQAERRTLEALAGAAPSPR